jgi:ferredoxin
MAKTPWVDKNECIGCGLCVSNCPDVFRMGTDDKAECFDASGATEEAIQSGAIDSCPVSCIHWQE